MHIYIHTCMCTDIHASEVGGFRAKRPQPGNRFVSFVRGAARREIICPLGLFAPWTVAPAAPVLSCPVARWLGSLAWLLAFGFSLLAFGFWLVAPPRWLVGSAPLLRFWLVGSLACVCSSSSPFSFLLARWLGCSLARWLVGSLARCLVGLLPAGSLARAIAG